MNVCKKKNVGMDNEKKKIQNHTNKNDGGKFNDP